MEILNTRFLLRFPVIVILLVHSITGMFNNGINDFGNLYLNQIGFSPVGVPLAWAIKLSHVFCAICLVLNRYVKVSCILNIFILLMGIILIHLKEGWFVVGGGRNGIEFNFLLIFVLLAIIFQAKSPNNSYKP